MRQKFQRILGIGWSLRKRVRQQGQVSEAKQKAGTWDAVRYHESNSRVDCDGLDGWMDGCLDVYEFILSVKDSQPVKNQYSTNVTLCVKLLCKGIQNFNLPIL